MISITSKVATNREPGVCESGAGFKCGAVEILMRFTRCFGRFGNAERTPEQKRRRRGSKPAREMTVGSPGNNNNNNKQGYSGEWKMLLCETRHNIPGCRVQEGTL